MEVSGKMCWLCGKNGSQDRLERHHIFGNANRNHSEEYGLVVWLCGEECHRNGKHAAHRDPDTARMLHEYGQRKWMEENGGSVEDFRKIFGKNYLEDEE